MAPPSPPPPTPPRKHTSRHDGPTSANYAARSRQLTGRALYFPGTITFLKLEPLEEDVSAMPQSAPEVSPEPPVSLSLRHCRWANTTLGFVFIAVQTMLHFPSAVHYHRALIRSTGDNARREELIFDSHILYLSLKHDH